MFKVILVLILMTCLRAFGAVQDASLVELAYNLDAKLFDEAFNECKTDVLNDIVDENVEFYHDIGGVLQGKEAFVQSIRDGICALDYKATRERKSTIDVFPLKDKSKVYAIWVKGEHDFYAHYSNDNKKIHTSRAKFDILWQKRQGEWRMTRAYSYNHTSGSQ